MEKLALYKLYSYSAKNYKLIAYSNVRRAKRRAVADTCSTASKSAQYET